MLFAHYLASYEHILEHGEETCNCTAETGTDNLATQYDKLFLDWQATTQQQYADAVRIFTDAYRKIHLSKTSSDPKQQNEK